MRAGAYRISAAAGRYGIPASSSRPCPGPVPAPSLSRSVPTQVVIAPGQRSSRGLAGVHPGPRPRSVPGPRGGLFPLRLGRFGGSGRFRVGVPVRPVARVAPCASRPGLPSSLPQDRPPTGSADCPVSMTVRHKMAPCARPPGGVRRVRLAPFRPRSGPVPAPFRSCSGLTGRPPGCVNFRPESYSWRKLWSPTRHLRSALSAASGKHAFTSPDEYPDPWVLSLLRSRVLYAPPAMPQYPSTISVMGCA
jgi:hypothetical protein